MARMGSRLVVAPLQMARNAAVTAASVPSVSAATYTAVCHQPPLRAASSRPMCASRRRSQASALALSSSVLPERLSVWLVPVDSVSWVRAWRERIRLLVVRAGLAMAASGCRPGIRPATVQNAPKPLRTFGIIVESRLLAEADS